MTTRAPGSRRAAQSISATMARPRRPESARALRGRGCCARRGAAAFMLAALLALAPAGCGEGDDAGLVVSAAASLTTAFERYAAASPYDARFSFGGSDQLAAQIRRGARPDIYAAADERLTAELHEQGFVREPVRFATGTLVIAVPSGSRIDSLADLEQPTVDVVIGDPSVPVGAYARELLDRLDPAARARIRANVRSEEPDVTAIVGKLTEGGADAGILYESDAVAAAGRLDAVSLPAAPAPQVIYAAAVVEEASSPGLAEAFVEGLVSREGARALERAGLDPLPR